jgi:poly-gamma-glutamate capsule biosynthesis protein CapA/YwtB (metallophosphatase superfamily)
MKIDWFIVLCVTIGLSAIGITLAVPHIRLAPATSAATAPEVANIPTGPVKILFVGDTMLDRSVAVHMQEVGGDKLFAGVAELFASPDLVVGNLEGTITTNNSIAQQDHTILHFTFATTAASLLARVGFNIVSLANNHSLDFGLDGYDQTIGFLHDVGIGVFGSPYNDLHIAAEATVKDKKLCFIGYHGLFDPDTSDVIAKIKEVRAQCDYIVVFSHWGVEYQHQPTAQQQQFAHDFFCNDKLPREAGFFWY